MAQELGLELCQDIGTGSFLPMLPQLRSINASYCYTLSAVEVWRSLQVQWLLDPCIATEPTVVGKYNSSSANLANNC